MLGLLIPCLEVFCMVDLILFSNSKIAGIANFYSGEKGIP